MHPIPDRLAHRYLDRLGVDAVPGEVDLVTLQRIHRAHVEKVAYENVDLYRGQAPRIARVACVERIVEGRGGYCFHLNGALAALLEWLGVELTRHKAGVQGRGTDPPGASGNHLGLTARIAGKTYLVDVGLGDGPLEPLPMKYGSYTSGGFEYRLRRSEAVPGGWRIDHDPRGAFVGFDTSPALATTSSFSAMHRRLSGSPQSGFVKQLVIFGRNEHGVEILQGCVRRSLLGQRTLERDVDDESEWWEIVIDDFGLAYGELSRAERRRTWRRVRASHDQWDAAGRP